MRLRFLSSTIKPRINVVFNLVGNYDAVNKASSEIEKIMLQTNKFKIDSLREVHYFDVIHNTNRTIITTTANTIINNCGLLDPDNARALNNSIMILTQLKWVPVIFYIKSDNYDKSNTNNYDKHKYLQSLERQHLVNHIYDLDAPLHRKVKDIKEWL